MKFEVITYRGCQTVTQNKVINDPQFYRMPTLWEQLTFQVSPCGFMLTDIKRPRPAADNAGKEGEM